MGVFPLILPFLISIRASFRENILSTSFRVQAMRVNTITLSIFKILFTSKSASSENHLTLRPEKDTLDKHQRYIFDFTNVNLY